MQVVVMEGPELPTLSKTISSCAGRWHAPRPSLGDGEANGGHGKAGGHRDKRGRHTADHAFDGWLHPYPARVVTYDVASPDVGQWHRLSFAVYLSEYLLRGNFPARI
jgi:hypothetical protein